VADKGFFLLADISGYTGFLTDSELEHAQAILQSLLELLIEHTRSPLVINKVEGDAVFSYAPAGSFRNGQTFVENIEQTYITFRKALELMAANTTCACNACRNMRSLDLKFIVHYGEYISQRLAGQMELTGKDITLAHRLMKNNVVEELHFPAYAIYTIPAVEALEIRDLCSEMVDHLEKYDSIGEVPVYVQDLSKIWEKRRGEIRLVVAPAEVLIEFTETFACSQIQLWEMFTDPESRGVFMTSQRQYLTDRKSGRTGPGAIYHCEHSNRASIHTILDWEPFEQYTTQETGLFPKTYDRATYLFIPVDGGTQLRILASKFHGPALQRWLSNIMFKYIGTGFYRKGCEALKNRLLPV
jgi:hypothetical protein